MGLAKIFDDVKHKVNTKIVDNCNKRENFVKSKSPFFYCELRSIAVLRMAMLTYWPIPFEDVLTISVSNYLLLIDEKKRERECASYMKRETGPVQWRKAFDQNGIGQ